jgi:hypothetical protein
MVWARKFVDQVFGGLDFHDDLAEAKEIGLIGLFQRFPLYSVSAR